MLFIENMNLMKLVCTKFTLYQNAFFYFFQDSEEDKSGMITTLKYLESPIVVEQLKIVLNKQKKFLSLESFHMLSTFFTFI